MSAPETVIEHPQVEIARLRAKCERAVDKLLTILDALGPDAEEEPSLGFSEIGSLHFGIGTDQTRIAEGTTDDREGEHDGCEPPEDTEETLGRSENMDQRRIEFGQDDREPSLGSVDHADQRHWGPHQAGWGPHMVDHEEQCEDEGAQCEDEGAVFDDEADDWGWEAPDGGTTYPSAGAPWPSGRAV